VLLVVTVAAAAYFLVGRSSSGAGTANDFVHVDQRIAATARSLPVAAQRVQRFTELHQFDAFAGAAITQMNKDLEVLTRLRANESAAGQHIIDTSGAATQSAIDAAGRYRSALAFSYRLANADQARQDLEAAAATLDQQAQAWANH
jgi:hypothetical protein